MSSWDHIYRRVERAAERMPPPTTDPGFDPSIFTAAECARFAKIRERYPTCTFRPGDLWMVSDDDLEFLAETAERVKAWQDAEREGEMPIATT